MRKIMQKIVGWILFVSPWYKKKIQRRMEIFDVAYKLYRDRILSYDEFKDVVCYDNEYIFCFEREWKQFPT